MGARPGRTTSILALRHASPSLHSKNKSTAWKTYPSTRKWANLVQWVRQRLVDLGQIDGSQRGIWRITPAGRARLSDEQTRTPDVEEPGTQPAADSVPVLTLRDLVNANLEEVKARLIAELRDLTPRAFEHFCKEFLGHLGYRNVEVTKRSQDGGIDGHGDFRQGAVSRRSAFQAKRWTENPVGRPEIDRLRGAIQGDYDHGVFLTTSRFTKDATLASYRKGAITVLLLDGPAIAELLLERGLGVRKLPIYVYDVDADFFDLEDE